MLLLLPGGGVSSTTLLGQVRQLATSWRLHVRRRPTPLGHAQCISFRMLEHPLEEEDLVHGRCVELCCCRPAWAGDPVNRWQRLVNSMSLTLSHSVVCRSVSTTNQPLYGAPSANGQWTPPASVHVLEPVSYSFRRMSRLQGGLKWHTSGQWRAPSYSSSSPSPASQPASVLRPPLPGWW